MAVPESELFYQKPGYTHIGTVYPQHFQKASHFHSLDNAKRCADENAGYSVFDESGKALYTSQAGFTPYLVKVSISDLNIRKGPGTNYAKTGKYTGKGVFTIVEEADGQVASRWGLLKSYQKNRDGWISLDYGKRV